MGLIQFKRRYVTSVYCCHAAAIDELWNCKSQKQKRVVGRSCIPTIWSGLAWIQRYCTVLLPHSHWCLFFSKPCLLYSPNWDAHQCSSPNALLTTLPWSQRLFSSPHKLLEGEPRWTNWICLVCTGLVPIWTGGLHTPDLNRRCHFCLHNLHRLWWLSLSLSSADTAILSLTGYHAISADGCQSIESRHCKFQQCMASVWGMNL